MIFQFDVKELAPIIKHAKKSKRHMACYGIKETDRPGLHLVHDMGMYLLSNGVPKQLDRRKGRSPCRVVYAKGHGPKTWPGKYRIGRVREVDPFENEIRRVAD